MADADIDELELFDDLYDNDVEAPAPAPKDEPIKAEPDSAPVHEEPTEDLSAPDADDIDIKVDTDQDAGMSNAPVARGGDYDRPIGIKEDGKMFIGGLNWETTDESLKNYFSQFGEVVDCQVMRDGATGRSRGFGFLKFSDPKVVNTVMVKEHFLDGKLIDPKRAIPREEQERTAKIFVGGVSQECTDTDFREFFEQFGRVLDATLMMDKDTGRPRGFGFVTFDSEAAVDRTLEQPLSIHNKFIEVKRAEPRGNLRDGDGGGSKFGRGNKGQFQNDNGQQAQTGQANPNNMTPAMMAHYWGLMQNMFQQQKAQLQMNANPMAAMQNNPQMMQQMMARNGGGMNPQMMQQMQQMQQGNMNFNGGGNGSPMNGGQGNRPAFNAQEQLMFEQQKYERQQNARMGAGNYQGGNTWDGMYDDVPAPAGMQGRGGGFAGRGRGGRGSQGNTPQPAAQAPANAPTGPKNAGAPGANYRGGGRGGRRGYHPYARGGF